MKLTQVAVDALKLKPGKTERTEYDDAIPGFGVRLRGAGGVWFLRYRSGNRQPRLKIGDISALSAIEARKRAANLYSKVAAGQDPAGQRDEHRARSGETVGALIQNYLVFKQAHVRPRSFVEIKRHLTKNAKSLHAIHIAKLDRRAIATCRSAVAIKRGEVTANRTLASLSAFLTWCLQEGLIDNHPAIRSARYAEKPRERVLSGPELRAIWQATADDSDYSAVVRLLMLTGCRASEIGGLRWSEIADGQVVLPPARTKNGREHIVALAPVVQALVAARPRRNDDFVFGRRNGRPLCGWNELKRALDQRIADSGFEFAEDWHLHDLRRSFASKLRRRWSATAHHRRTAESRVESAWRQRGL